MNIRQKLYESNCRTTMLLKIYQKMHHQKQLEKIENRKCKVASLSPKNFPNRPHRLNPLIISTKQKADTTHTNRLSEIIFKKAAPQLNDCFVKFEQNKRIISFNRRKDISQQIEKENCDFFARMDRIHAFISPRNLDYMYKTSHNKLIKKMSKFSHISYDSLEKILSQPRLFNRSMILKTGNDKGDK